MSIHQVHVSMMNETIVNHSQRTYSDIETSGFSRLVKIVLEGKSLKLGTNFTSKANSTKN